MRTRHTRALLALAALAGAASMVAAAPPAFAACHAFTVAASPDHVDEGGTVTVTVSRDAAVNPSNVDVSSVDGTATGDQDFPAVHRTISFTTETKQTFTIPTTDDSTAEPAETFKLHLSNPGGCAINPNFTLGPDATVSISASDATTSPPPTTAPTTKPTTAAGSTSRSTTTSTAATAATAPSPPTSANAAVTTPATTTSTPSTREVAASDSGSDSETPAVLIVIAIVVVVAAAAGGALYVLQRRRSLS